MVGWGGVEGGVRERWGIAYPSVAAMVLMYTKSDARCHQQFERAHAVEHNSLKQPSWVLDKTWGRRAYSHFALMVEPLPHFKINSSLSVISAQFTRESNKIRWFHCYYCRPAYSRCGHSILQLWFLSSFFLLAYSQRSQIGCLPYFHSWCGPIKYEFEMHV